ncbi:MAG: glycosyl hydrolase family 95 catalytic domain-containing protein [Pirellulaceae bacterium]
MMKSAVLGVVLFGCAHMVAGATAPSPLPDASLNLSLTAPINTWDEAIPLGNGAMGVLLWGDSSTLCLSLDRGDLWDERPSKKHLLVKERFNWTAMQRMVAENKMDEFNEVFDSNYEYDGPPSKLPAGRVELVLDPSQIVERFELNLATAEGLARFTTGPELRVFVNACTVKEPVAMLRIPGPAPREVRLKSPDSVQKLGYAPPRTGEADGLRWFEQEAADGFAYAVCAAWKRVGNETLLAMTVATRDEGTHPQAVAQARVEAALQAGYDKQLQAHTQWWAQFWERSQVFIPAPHILQQYYLVRYFYGAASRRGAPPMPLQGVWSADAGSLPPWKGDYHNDLNTQMTYMGYQAAGHFDEGATFLDLLWDLQPTFRQFAKDFYDAPGAAVPGVMSLKGQALGGWGQYSLSPTMGAWNAHLFYLHWRYTGDEQFLRTRAYPWCREIGECLLHLLKPDTNGVLRLPLSSSPEIFDNSRSAFLIPNSNYDLMSLKMLFLAIAEMAEAVGNSPDAQQWSHAAKQLGDWHVAADGSLLLDEKTPLPGSHRHLSNLIGLYPFNLITTDGDVPRDREIITASLKQWDASGTSAWCGYSFSWMAALRARVGDPEAALHHLDIYMRAFVLRNGFHANGDQTKSGFSAMTYRPFTLEGNFLAMAAVHEMLLQSWSPAPGTSDVGSLRIFPAMPWCWHEASFASLRSEGGHCVSARRENNATTWFHFVAGRDGTVRIRDTFGGREPQWSRGGVEKVGDNFEVALKRGEVLEATLTKPQEIPPAPAGATHDPL